ncbi:MAG: class I SAM-dependent methyltransferase [Clostridia bacterium]|nr:class I SAM-dependent methyltransferase [Clostridia bacterium]
MNEQTMRDNQTLVSFWNSVFALSEADKEGARQEGIGPWEALAPSEKLLSAVCALGGRKKVLDYGCGNGWAAIAAAKSGCEDVTAADPAPNAAEMTQFVSELLDVSDRVHPVRIDYGFLKSVPSETYDGLILSNVLDTVPPETAEEILREAARVMTEDAEVLVGLNYWLSPEAAAEKGTELTDGRLLYLDGVLRLVSRTDAEWEAIFAPYFTVESLTYFAWQGEAEEKRRLFRLKKRQ